MIGINAKLFLTKDTDTIIDCPDYSNVDKFTFIDNGDKNTMKDILIYSCDKSFTDSIDSSNCRLLIFSCLFNNVAIHKKSFSPIYLHVTSDSLFLQSENIIDSCQFKNCKGKGGAIYINADNWTKITISNCLFENNEGNYYSGALELDCIYVTIQNCTFINNKANSGSQITVFVT